MTFIFFFFSSFAAVAAASAEAASTTSWVWMFLTTFLKVIFAIRVSPNSSLVVSATVALVDALGLAAFWAFSAFGGGFFCDFFGGDGDDDDEDTLGRGRFGRAAKFFRKVCFAAFTEAASSLLVGFGLKMSTSINFAAFGTDCFTLIAGGGQAFLFNVFVEFPLFVFGRCFLLG